jgi:hypothetical protein
VSIIHPSGAKAEPGPDKEALEVRDALAALDVPGMRRFAGRLFLAARIPRARVARAFRCSVVQLRRDCRIP